MQRPLFLFPLNDAHSGVAIALVELVEVEVDDEVLLLVELLLVEVDDVVLVLVEVDVGHASSFRS